MPETSLGLDFGTTNTLLSAARDGGAPVLFRYPYAGREYETFRSVLCFWQDYVDGSPQNHHDAGPSAMARVIEAPKDYRFIQSFKTFAASPLFDSTRIYGDSYEFSDLLYVFLERFFGSLRLQTGALPERIVVGRPVRYAGSSPSSELAQARYDAAFQRLGFTEVHHVYEPVAAAYHFAQRLAGEATILVGDFGGGTSDFSVIRFSAGRTGISAEPLSHAGVGIAGDAFDYRIIDNIVSPVFGKGSTYRSWGKELTFPKSYFNVLARWEQLSVMAGTRAFADLRRLIKDSSEPDKIETFVRFVEGDLAHSLYQAVSATKTALSKDVSARFDFDELDIRISAVVERRDFEQWIAQDLQDICRCIDEALEKAGLEADAIDKVFLTGGTSLVPAVRALFETRFAPEKLESGDELLSVASGLALLGQDPNLDDWTIKTGD
jgi:hypothetical chaperone protein